MAGEREERGGGGGGEDASSVGGAVVKGLVRWTNGGVEELKCSLFLLSTLAMRRGERDEVKGREQEATAGRARDW